MVRTHTQLFQCRFEFDRPHQATLPDRRLKVHRQDPTLSDTIRVLLLQQLAENSYLDDREKKILGVIA